MALRRCEVVGCIIFKHFGVSTMISGAVWYDSRDASSGVSTIVSCIIGSDDSTIASFSLLVLKSSSTDVRLVESIESSVTSALVFDDFKVSIDITSASFALFGTRIGSSESESVIESITGPPDSQPWNWRTDARPDPACELEPTTRWRLPPFEMPGWSRRYRFCRIFI